ncbi:MAG: S8 family serine peptidase, partial [Anaerolineae bacterium]|nr:S8 family serine peptidase [Anaerolineae bacterium]
MSRKERLVLVVGLVGMLAIWAAAAGVMSGSTHLSGVSMLPTQAVLPTSLPTVIPSMSSPQPAPTIDIAQSAVQPQQDAAAPEAADQRLVVRFVPETDAAARQMYIESIGGTVTREIEALNTVVVTVPDAAVALPASPVMAASEPDYYVSALVDVPTSDTYFSQQWGLSAIGAPDAWQQLPVSAPAVTVAVIDSGICAEHPDLAGRIVAGYDFVEEDAVPQDLLGHGCAVAGVIAANVDNGEGIAGVAPNAQIMPVRVLDAQGIGTYSDVAAAIVYAVDQGAQIINLSLGGTNPSSLLADAVDYAAARDVLVIAA